MNQLTDIRHEINHLTHLAEMRLNAEYFDEFKSSLEVLIQAYIFTTVLNSYGMSVYEATNVSDTLFQSVVRGKFQFADLESALGYVVPIAAQAGIAFEELMATLSTATRHGLHLDMAARGLAMGLQNIINPSEGAAKAAKKYAKEVEDGVFPSLEYSYER